MTEIDYSKPLATLLREGTSSTLEIHDSVSTRGVKLLLSGREEYARYLMILWHVYELSIIFLFKNICLSFY
jgi:hypothetical protein